jgi:hypothetical protein
MPNAINPNDFNVDYFSSGFLGVTTVNDFREYLLQNNLEELPQELVTGAAGNFTDNFNEKGLEKDINYGPITNPGDIDGWNLAGNFEVSLFDISYQNPSQNVGANEYGPSVIQPYNEPGLVPQETGFKQYPTSSGGDDLKQALKDFALNDQLNLGPGSAINFDSELNDVAKERRKKEAVNRLKLKAKNQILGKLNLDPFGLLAGQDLILKDYDITTRPTVGGKILNFVTDAIGVEIPTSPIPDGAFGKWGDNDGPQSYEDLMKSTGAGTKSLIFNAVSTNKYGPILQEPSGKLANNLGAGQAPQPKKYTDNVEQKFKSNALIQEEKPLVDRLNQQVGKIISNIAGQAGVGVPEKDLTPQEFENPSTTTDDLIKNSEYGFDELPNDLLGTDTWDMPGTSSIGVVDDGFGRGGKIFKFDNGPIGTVIPRDVEPKFFPGTIPAGTENDGQPFRRGMYWGENTNPFRRGLLKYTQDLVNNSKTNSQKDKARFIGAVNDDTNFDAKTGRHNLYSMGNTVNGGEGDETFYCRSWSVRNPYRKVNDLIRHGSNNGEGGFNPLTRPDFGLSVLGDNGFVKVAPYADKDGLKVGNPAVQKYMLSIENLAWQNTDHLLRVPPCEKGPNGGRIMWFPPYDINFTDNSSVNWDSTQIIGRGEPIYTYNSTERTGTLSFKIIVDHSMDMVDIRNRKEGEEALFKYFAGCEYPLEEAIPLLPVTDIEEIKIETTYKDNVIPKKEVPNPPSPPGPIKFYFRNAYRFDKDKLGTTLNTELTPPSPEKSPNYPKNWYRANPNGYLRGTIPTSMTATTAAAELSLTRNEESLIKLEEMVNFLISPDGKRFKIKIVGKTSDAGVSNRNKKLGEKRANTTKDYMYKLMVDLENETGRIPAYQLGSTKDFPQEANWKNSNLRWDTSTTGEVGQSLSQTRGPNGDIIEFRDEGQDDGLTPDVTVPTAVDDRNATISLEYNQEIDDLYTIDNKEVIETVVDREGSTETKTTVREINELTPTEIKTQRDEALAKRLAERASRYMAWECSYFEKMKQEDSFIYETLTEKLKFFHPAFHSMTPEGFNSRLTFLKQCTRQGPNIGPDDEPGNLSFGKPPICVLRIGDFYHTKIVIDSVNLTFDPLQWDLNPEGIGVQPMLCNVDLNFKFIGGSSLGGPVSQLQNAVGFNFFANTGLYNPRTIYSSIQQYEKNKPDAKSGLGTEIEDDKINNTSTSKSYGFGAYIKPNQILNSKGEFEDEPQPPIPPQPEENIKKQQKDDEGIVEQKTDEFSQSELDQIKEEFKKDAEKRAGAFTVLFYSSVNSTLKNGNNITEVDLGSANYNGEDRGEITPRTITLTSNQESLEYFEVTYPNGTVVERKRDDLKTSSWPNGLISSVNGNKRVTLWDPVDRENSLLGQAYNGVSYSQAIEPGTYKFRGIAQIQSTLEEQGTTELSEKIYSAYKTLKVILCTDAGDGNVVFFSDIPKDGLC